MLEFACVDSNAEYVGLVYRVLPLNFIDTINFLFRSMGLCVDPFRGDHYLVDHLAVRLPDGLHQ